MDKQERPVCKTSPSLLNPKFRAKFVPLKENYDELNWKYQAYKKGSPNIYEDNLEKLKMTAMTNELKVLELPSVDYLIDQMKSVVQESGVNKRNYDLYPSMRQKYASKFRDLISDKQEIKDFMTWFEEKDKEIQRKNIKESKKFHFRQSLIASGFNQMVSQICSISRARSQILKMLWNRQNDEISNIMNSLHDHSTNREKRYLENIRTLHVDYQDQILQLTKQNFRLKRKYEEELAISEGSLNTLRLTKKKIKKYESLIKEISKINNNLKAQNLSLLQENYRLLMQNKSISSDQAKVLSMRVLQIKKEKKLTKKTKSFKKMFKKIHENMEECIEDIDPRVIQEKKAELLDFLKGRIKEYPGEKLFIMKDELIEDDEHHNNENIQTYLKKIINTTESRQIISRYSEPLQKHCYTQTENPVTQFEEKETQTPQLTYAFQAKDDSRSIKESFKILDDNVEQNFQKIREKSIKVRNSHLLVEINRAKELKRFSSFMNIEKKPSFLQPKDKNSLVKELVHRSRKNMKSEESEKIEEENYHNDEDSEQQKIMEIMKIKNKNIKQRHQVSFMKNSNQECEQMASILVNQSKIEEEGEKSLQTKKPKNKELYHQKQINNYVFRMGEFTVAKEPQKKLSKVLVQVFKNLYVYGKHSFLGQLIELIKNKYGNVSPYIDKLMHIIYTVDYYKSEESLLAALSYVTGFKNNEYREILSSDVSQLYVKLYFYLSLKNPKDNQFNLWKNHTSLKKLHSEGFHSIIKDYINESKIAYIKDKIQQFVGVDQTVNEDQFCIELNPLLLYVLEAYLVEKNNYYESYHRLVDFLGQEDYISIQAFLFLLQLLCFDEVDKKTLILQHFGDRKDRSMCLKDCFYRVCVKYELPLFEMMRILKQSQSKQIHSIINQEYFEIQHYDSWIQLKSKLEHRLRSCGKLGNSLLRVIDKLHAYIRKILLDQEPNDQKQIFSFLYRIILYIAHFQ